MTKWNNKVRLIKKETETTGYYESTEVITNEKVVFCRVEEVSASLYTEAIAIDKKLSCRVIIRKHTFDMDYNFVELDNVEYQIFKKYNIPNTDFLELTLEEF